MIGVISGKIEIRSGKNEEKRERKEGKNAGRIIAWMKIGAMWNETIGTGQTTGIDRYLVTMTESIDKPSM